LKAAILALLFLAPAGAYAEVVDSAANGFTIRVALTIKAPPADVYQKLVHNVGDWWNPAHTFSGNAHNLSIDDTPMGCFCEKYPQGGGVRHLEVVMADPGKALVMIGGLGPMQSIAATGSMRFSFAAVEGGTKFEMVYSVAGYLPAGMQTWAKPADGMLTEQFTRMQNYIEQGSPTPKK
jgi:uncharacterized protein YndB with AHSA1/START domain